MPRPVWVLAAIITLSSFGGCAPPCSTVDEQSVSFDGGQVNASKTYYETSAIDGQYLHFPGGRRYEVRHGLAAKPTDITTYLSFEERPLLSSNFSESAGNQAVIEAVDEEKIRVFNDTCAEFYLRLTARVDLIPADDGGTPVDSGSDAPSDAPADAGSD